VGKKYLIGKVKKNRPFMHETFPKLDQETFPELHGTVDQEKISR
jgi:hypothetical protein